MLTSTWIRVPLSVCLALAVVTVTGSRAVAQDALELVKEGRKLEQAGQLDEGLDRYRKAAAANPKLFEAQLALGRALNLAGDYAPARQALQQALALSTDANRNTALAALGVSYAFEGKAAESEKYYKQIYDAQVAASQFEEAGATANAIARVYLEAADAGAAEKWYRTGHETAKKASAAAPAGVDLREWRWLNAQGRIAARKGQFSAARQFAAQGKAILDQGTNADQAAYYPYLVGYIEFYAKNYAKAIEELLKADQRDVFVLGLLAQAYDKTGDAAKARETFAKVMASPSHSINAAYARPLARQYLAR
jgi:tetratricopeptide (TPR) repeat protein